MSQVQERLSAECQNAVWKSWRTTSESTWRTCTRVFCPDSFARSMFQKHSKSSFPIVSIKIRTTLSNIVINILTKIKAITRWQTTTRTAKAKESQRPGLRWRRSWRRFSMRSWRNFHRRLRAATRRQGWGSTPLPSGASQEWWRQLKTSLATAKDTPLHSTWSISTSVRKMTTASAGTSGATTASH